MLKNTTILKTSFSGGEITQMILIIVLLLLLLLGVGFLIFKFFYSKKKKPEEKKSKKIEHKVENTTSEKELYKELKKVDILKKKYQDLIKEENQFLLKKANLSKTEVKNKLYKNIRQELDDYVNNSVLEANAEIITQSKRAAQTIIVETMESIFEPNILQNTFNTIDLEDDSIKGKIIGKDGRNKRHFEMTAGVDLVIEKTPHITISTANPIRREIATRVMRRLITSKSFEPVSVDAILEEERKSFDKTLIEIGKEALEKKMHIFGINKDIYPYIGRLKFRYSFGQNVLSHSIECGKIAYVIAKKLDLDPEKAKKAAFFHDIGKSIDFEESFDHVDSGVRLAKQFKLEKYIVDSISDHHTMDFKVTYPNIYTAVARIADMVSGGRPGARIDSYNEFLTRVKTMEEICLKFDGVKDAHAIKAGRYLRVIVSSDKYQDSELSKLAYDIKKELEENNITNKFQINLMICKVSEYDVTTEIKKEEKSNN